MSGGCKTATQVTVEIKTVGVLSCSDLKGVDVIVAGASVEAEQRTDLAALTASVPRGGCDSERTIGTLVVTPGGPRAAIVVVARIDEGAKCTAKDDYKGCIVARRAFAFVEHAALTLPISLEASCKDVPCTAITSCRTGACVSSEAECNESSGQCVSEAEPQPLPDGGFVPPDGAIVSDGATADGPVGDGAPTDAIGDALDDGIAEVGTDGPLGSPGNVCPQMMGASECGGATLLCCYQGTFFCGSESGCSLYPRFACTGRKNCGASQYCCGTDPDASLPTSQCGPAPCDHYLCNTIADCPGTHPYCIRRYYPPGGSPGGPLFECSTTP